MPLSGLVRGCDNGTGRNCDVYRYKKSRPEGSTCLCLYAGLKLFSNGSSYGVSSYSVSGYGINYLNNLFNSYEGVSSYSVGLSLFVRTAAREH